MAEEKLVDVKVVKGTVGLALGEYYQKGDIMRITEERAIQLDSNFIEIISDSSVKLDKPAEIKADVPPEEGPEPSAEDLAKQNNRAALDKMAKELGIDSSELPTKKAVAEAIVEARG